MQTGRREFIQLTAAGLIHVSARPLLAAGDRPDAALLVRRAQERGHTDLGWLNAYHSFSFGEFYDQRHMGFRSLRVINEDRIKPGRGFPTHPHRDMEILTYLLSGALEHRDSLGRGAIIRPGDVQTMSAGTGIRHSEFNPSSEAANHLLQIWIKPAQRGLRPRYQQQRLETGAGRNRLQPIAAPEATPGVVAIQQDAHLHSARLDAGAAVAHTVERGRHAWLQVASGDVTVNGAAIGAGDAIAASRPTQLHISARTNAEVLLFDLG